MLQLPGGSKFVLSTMVCGAASWRIAAGAVSWRTAAGGRLLGAAVLACLVTPGLDINQVYHNSQARALSLKSGFGEFLKEPPVLGGTWYSKKGPQPVFSSSQQNGTVVHVQLGFDALMSCKVTAVEKDLVSWFVVKMSYSQHHTSHQEDADPVTAALVPPSLALTLLTVGFHTYSSDSRFLVDFARPNDFRLRVERVSLKDEGYYHCQIATHPPQIIWTRLKIIRPIVRILDQENKTVSDIHHHIQSKLSLHCIITRAPRHSSSVVWSYQKNKMTNSTLMLNDARDRSGIKISTWRDTEGEIFSHLEMVQVGINDGGFYFCSLPGSLFTVASASVKLHIVTESLEPVLNCVHFQQSCQLFVIMSLFIILINAVTFF